MPRRNQTRYALAPVLSRREGEIERELSAGVTDWTACWYQCALLCPQRESSGQEWTAFKDFRDAGPFSGGFAANAGRPVARDFSGRVRDFAEAGRAPAAFRRTRGRPSAFPRALAPFPGCPCCSTTRTGSFRPVARCCLKKRPRPVLTWSVWPWPVGFRRSVSGFPAGRGTEGRRGGIASAPCQGQAVSSNRIQLYR
jgi:hypothetical protein